MHIRLEMLSHLHRVVSQAGVQSIVLQTSPCLSVWWAGRDRFMCTSNSSENKVSNEGFKRKVKGKGKNKAKGPLSLNQHNANAGQEAKDSAQDSNKPLLFKKIPTTTYSADHVKVYRKVGKAPSTPDIPLNTGSDPDASEVADRPKLWTRQSSKAQGETSKPSIKINKLRSPKLKNIVRVTNMKKQFNGATPSQVVADAWEKKDIEMLLEAYAYSK